MEDTKQSSTKELGSIKLIRGQRGNFGWEIKLFGEDEEDIKNRLDKLNEKMVKSYDLNKPKEDK